MSSDCTANSCVDTELTGDTFTGEMADVAESYVNTGGSGDDDTGELLDPFTRSVSSS